MKHANIAVFVPHNGCPNQCSFCNQRTISGTAKQPTPDDVASACETAMLGGCDGAYVQLAFFGGSFTAIDRAYMLSLLEAAQPYIKSGFLNGGIRVSTRPDCIDNDVLQLLKAYGVTAIELGAQSMRDEVLKENNRGHSTDDVYTASELIKEYGFELGLQMMTGLYTDNDEGAKFTANEFVKINPKTVRIYPTIVLENTELATLYKSGAYKPQSIDEAVELCAELLLLFEKNDIKVIRLGLHSIDMSKYVAGPWHPAFSELCENRIYRDIIKTHFGEKNDYTVYVAGGEMSKAVGQKKSNVLYFKDKGYNLKFEEDLSLSARNIRIKGSE